MSKYFNEEKIITSAEYGFNHLTSPNIVVRNDIEQGTPEWHEIRSYSCGSTGAYSVLKNGFYPDKLKSSEYGGYCSKEMQRGHDLEPEARFLLETLLTPKGITIEEVGAVLNKKWPHCHDSPDGVLIQNNEFIGCCEIKCFQEPHHKKILEDGIETEIKAQLMWHLWMSETRLGYFVAYNPDMKEIKDRLYIEKIILSDDYIYNFNNKVSKGLERLQDG